MLYVVSTPIGNLEDITIRAINTLKAVSLILAEDTRRTGILLKAHGISNKMLSFNDYNKEGRTRIALGVLKEGKDVALVSDAGTPGINDPAFHIVRECIREGIAVSPIPGAAAAISALVCSGLPTDRFTFYGFVPKKPGKREKLFSEIRERDETAVMYESPHRIIETMEEISKAFPEKDVVIARELTKKFEEFIRGKSKEVYEKIKDKGVKGEIVLLLK